ncbi:MAG: hypothetical protein LBQ22_09615 [Bacteroidales bacterium]|nr:hypothetical protein [Bacteroidales bacterium]
MLIKPMKYINILIDHGNLLMYYINMNEKKSPFGDLCHQHRGKFHLSEQAMGQKIEELGYKLGNKPDSNKQPVVSQFEREIDPVNVDRKQHRDPPLEYVETCAELFKLSSPEKYSLFVAALDSSEKIVIDKDAIEGGIKTEIIKIVTSLLLACTELDKIIAKDEDNKKKNTHYIYSDDKRERELLEKWKHFINAFQSLIEEIEQHPLEYKVLSS